MGEKGGWGKNKFGDVRMQKGKGCLQTLLQVGDLKKSLKRRGGGGGAGGGKMVSSIVGRKR